MGKGEDEGDMEREAAEANTDDTSLDGSHLAARVYRWGLEGEKAEESVGWGPLVDDMESPP